MQSFVFKSKNLPPSHPPHYPPHVARLIIAQRAYRRNPMPLFRHVITTTEVDNMYRYWNNSTSIIHLGNKLGVVNNIMLGAIRLKDLTGYGISRKN